MAATELGKEQVALVFLALAFVSEVAAYEEYYGYGYGGYGGYRAYGGSYRPYAPIESAKKSYGHSSEGMPLAEGEKGEASAKDPDGAAVETERHGGAVSPDVADEE